MKRLKGKIVSDKMDKTVVVEVTNLKKHPKEEPDLPTPFRRVITGSLVDCLTMADVFIFDVISTAFNIAAATNKPIIYFDIGVRNIHHAVLPHLKERAIWIDARRDKSVAYLKKELKVHLPHE